MTIVCPGLEQDLADAPHPAEVVLRVGDGGGDAATLRVCRRAPTADVLDVAVCTQDFYGFTRNASAFWHGSPPYERPRHTLLDAFVVYHARVHGLHVTVNDFGADFRPLVQRYLGRNVSYRGGWGLPALGPSDPLDYEVLAEATCAWEHRLDARWVYILHAADNFAVPVARGELVRDALARLDPRVYSGAHVPMVQAYRATAGAAAGGNVLQRWNLLGPEFEQGVSRHTPVLNPRHLEYAVVHWNTAPTPDFRKNMEYTDAVPVLGLHTVHIMALARPELNRAAGRADASLDELAARLQDALEREFAPPTPPPT